ncbi:MAG: alpha/beta hydrolase [Bacteroidia bacterium]|jgi:alpha-beta hydrolase superfamily lysophospholipase|nr:alpha/beta hydrolase [Bacteroidia bacterium]
MKNLLVIWTLLFWQWSWSQQYQPDILNGFEQTSLIQPGDYDGKVITTIVRKTQIGNTKAVLYVHGFSDYFFQEEMANQFIQNGFDFYAIDLRKYGRSHLPHQRLFDVRNIHEYDADVDTALKLIAQKDYNRVLLSGHSTGGLIVTCYANTHQNSSLFDAVYLNSPFLDMNLSGFTESVVVPFGSFLGKIMPRAKASGGLSPYYGWAIHKAYYGEWTFDTTWKPITVPAVNFGWTRAIHKGHKEVQKGNCVDKPTLILRSDHSTYGKKWSNDFKRGDAVLDVQDIKTYGMRLGKNVTVLTINDAMHDMALSTQPAREQSYKALFNWLNEQFR